VLKYFSRTTAGTPLVKNIADSCGHRCTHRGASTTIVGEDSIMLARFGSLGGGTDCVAIELWWK